MSRVDDDRDAARVAARLAEQKRTEQGKQTEKSQQNQTFKKLVGKQSEAATGQQQQQKTDKKDEKQNVGRSAIAHLLESAEAQGQEAAHQTEAGNAQQSPQSAFKGRLGAKVFNDKVQSHTKPDGEQAQKLKAASDQGLAQTGNAKQSENAGAAQRSEGRSTDAKVSNEKIEERKEASDANATTQAEGAKAMGEKGDLKVHADKGGSGGQGGSKDKDGSQGMGPGFRYNPALMAPVPVAKTKEASGSERLRKVANELAQKIVAGVRVGTNAMGKIEFQIDLKNDVLKGLSMKISCNNGKISAVFQGADKDVKKLLEEQKEALEAALSSRGLKLEDFKIEAKA